jgi:hypothetical protein
MTSPTTPVDRAEFVERLQITARRTPSGLHAFRSLLSITAGPIRRTPAPEDRLLLELAFSIGAGVRPAACRRIDKARALGIDRERLLIVLQLSVLASEEAVLGLAVEMLGRFDGGLEESPPQDGPVRPHGA